MRVEEVDYVIVGGGSAGCVLASRLTEDRDVRVLLLEAGGRDWHPVIHIPLGVGHIRQANMFDWGYVSEPQPNLDGRRIELKRGKVLGGSSSINFMAHNRGNRSDYERWVRLGVPEWSYEHLLPYFKRLETWREGKAPHRGTDGPVGITYTCRSDPLGWAVLEAAQAAGYPIVDDLNAPEPNGFGLAQSAIDRGRRASASNAYLRPIRGRAESHRQDALARHEDRVRRQDGGRPSIPVARRASGSAGAARSDRHERCAQFAPTADALRYRRRGRPERS